MKDEYAALPQKKTWSLVPYKLSMNVVGCRRVYKKNENEIKERADGSIERYKAATSGQSYTQQEGLSFLLYFQSCS